uniref:NADH-ubiquinone oxidoreductase chain 2 n=1 Tax=Obscurella hidalgoi TaxID=1663726 RepID=A0A0M3WMC2_OBSHI|nr:NADH dehydrogenase subunit 2 [Obscurella hidalgoi]AKL90689.1 NADH dehydrogenase subunit 2 [Obscurella hidalgoi]
MRPNLPFVYMFLLLVGFGTFFSISAVHWLGAWVGLELNLIGFLPILIYQKSSLETEAAIKYFIVQALGSSLLMAASLLSFNLSLSWEFAFSLIGDPPFAYIWGFLLLSSLMLKVGAFPFHFWLPSVMVSSSWFPCAILATWQKLAPLFLFTIILGSGLVSLFFQLLCLLAVAGAWVGGIGGINQTQVRAILGYSSISHMGWMVYGACCNESLLEFYLMIYILVTGCVFIAFWHLNLSNMKGTLGLTSNFFDYLGVFILLLSLGGLPPLLGFIPKLLVIGYCIPLWNFMVVLFLLLGSLISLFYYLVLFFAICLSFFSSKFLYFFLSQATSNFSILGFSILANLSGVGAVMFLNLLSI